MTLSLKHAFTSPKSDGTDSSLVRPSNWNAEHELTCAINRILGRITPSPNPGDVEELTPAQVMEILAAAAYEGVIDDDGTPADSPSPPGYQPSIAAGSNYKLFTNDKAFTLVAPVATAQNRAQTLNVFLLNGTSPGVPGAVTFSGFISGDPSGDSLTTTAGDLFIAYITAFNLGGTDYATVHMKQLVAN